MEAGAHFHQDPGHTVSEPRPGAVRASRESGGGWVTFAAVYLLIAGGMNVLWGAAALAGKSNFHESGLVWSTLNTWGWISIIVGPQVLGSLMVHLRTFAGQWLAGLLAVLAIFASFLGLGAYPVWAILAMTANGLVIWAVTAHGDEFD
ncbi:MAG: DUF7144 family membrane protein [Solirubrobacteraceae bacterium]